MIRVLERMLLSVTLILTGVSLLQARRVRPTFIRKDVLPLGRRTTVEEEQWRSHAIRILWEERERMDRTPLIKFELKGIPNADIFFKNETASKTRTLKHRFVWALLMWAIVEGK
ncbi:hypothetical protein TELCIR_19014, partial [Teladorsagia circumcincta]